jgi:hypothetical protein
MRVLVAAAVAFSIAAPARAIAGDDVGAVKAAFKSYQSALLEKNGARCVAVVDRGTVDYYQRMHDLAVGGKADDVKKLAILDKLMVLRMRHQIPLADLKRMDGRAMLAHGVTQGWVGSNVAKVEPGAVEITGDRASLVFVVDGKPTPVKIGLRREGGAWRIDLLSLFQLSGGAFRERQKKSGQSEDDFVVSLVEQLVGKPVPPTIWNPPR